MKRAMVGNVMLHLWVAAAAGCANNGQEAMYESAHFRIVYARQGAGAPPAADGNGNDIPDYVEWTAEAGEHALAVLLAQGWPRPPAYDRQHELSPVGRYEIEVSRLDIEGYTEPVRWLGDNPHTAAGAEDAWMARISVTNDFLALGYPAQREYLQLFVAHEFVHLTIAGMAWGSTGMLDCAHEWTAAWMESVIYPDIPNNEDYIPYYLDDPDVSLVRGHEVDFDACYGLWLFPEFVAEHHDPVSGGRAIRDFWLEAAGQDTSSAAHVHTALNNALHGELASVLADFAVASGGTAFAPDHTMPPALAWSADIDIPALTTEATLVCGRDQGWDSEAQGDGLPSLAADHVEIQSPASCRIRIMPSRPDPGLFARALVTRVGQFQVDVQELPLSTWLDAGTDVERLLVVVGNHGPDHAPPYRLEIER